MRLEGKSLKSDFLRFIIPSIIAQWVFSLYTMVDGIFVARGVSEVALTAVNISMPFTTGLFSISILFAVGNSTIVAILLGQGEKERANEVFTQNVVLLCTLSVLITILVIVFLEPFARFLGATDNILSYAKTYIGTIAPFSMAYILSYSFETLIKTDGYPKLATIYVTSGSVLNCILDYILVMVLHKGVWGAAFATGISQAAVILLYLWHFLGPKGTIRFSKFHLMPSEIWRQIRNGMSSGVTEFSSGIIIFFFNQAILKYIGEYALVSYTIISYVNTIVVMSMAGIAQGSQPLISYYYGKNEPGKYKKLLKYGITAALVGSVGAVVVCYMGAGGIFYSMNPKQDDAPVINTERVVIVDSVINTGKSIMRIIDELKNHNPGIDVIIAANVIQNEAAELFKDYLVFATRLSKNSFVGVNQSKQTGKTGPDTADRLFNLIKKRY